jgi:hypothetical protein
VTPYERSVVVLAASQLVVSGLGFIVVAWTLRVLIRSIDAQSSAGVAARQMELENVMLTYPNLYKYFYQGQEIDADDPEYARAMAATQMLTSFLDGYFQQRGRYRQMWPDDKWERYIQEHVRKSSMLRTYVRENHGLLSPEFVTMCQEIRAEECTPS